MRRLRYQVAASLDGYIAGPNGEFDWIPMDPDIDFAELFNQFDTLIMGRRSYDAMQGHGGGGAGAMPGRVYVCSSTLRQEEHPDVTIVSGRLRETVEALKAEPGKDIWLFGGGALFRSLAALRLVDTVEVAVVPVLLGSGTPLAAASSDRVPLRLTGQRVYRTSGIVLLEYATAG